MLVQEEIRALYAPVRIATVIECFAIAALLILFALAMRSFLYENTGISPDSGKYREIDATYHRALIRKSVLFSLLGILLCAIRALDAVFYGMPKSVLTHDPNDFGNSTITAPAVEWFGVICLVACVIFIFYSFYFFSLVKEEVKMKYEMEG
jgi:cytochrome bd-type quinol oxidase subunit 2